MLDVPSYMLGKKAGGGSGGTTDYSQLTNKPSINEVTLAGNKSSSDLKLQSEINSTSKLDSDLVDDTNSTNKFVSASDITNWNGKYSKPSGGIPDTDLSSAVQTSLGKADTALQTETYTGTITSVKMNGSTISSSGEADLGTVITQHQDISGKEDTSNKVTSMSSSSTDTQYPSAKAVYDALQNAGGGGMGVKLLDMTNQGAVNVEDLEAGFYFVSNVSNTNKLVYTKNSQGTKSSLFSGSSLDTAPLKLLVIFKKYSEANNQEIYATYLDPYGRTNALQKWVSGNLSYSATKIDANTTSWNIWTVSGDYGAVNRLYVGYKNNLTTTNKTDFVGAINEINPKGFTGYDATKTQVLKNVNGTLTWITEE